MYLFLVLFAPRPRSARAVQPGRGATDVAQLTKTKLPGNVREVWVPKGKPLAGPIATLLKQDTSIFLLGTIAHITRKC